MKTAKRWISKAAFLGLTGVLACWQPESSGEGGQNGGTGQQFAAIACSPHGSQVILLVETSQRMGQPSGFMKGNKPLSRFEAVKDMLKRSLPHLKKDIDFGLLTFPYDGSKQGNPHVPPTSCGVGPLTVVPGSPYGWIVSSLEHVVVGGNAAVAGALASARAWFQANPSGGKDRLVVLFTAGEDECGGDVMAEIQALKAMGIPTVVFAPENAPEFSGRISQWANAGGRPNPGHTAGVFPVRPNGTAGLRDTIVQMGAIEECDGLDNDCDGESDEDLTEACENECGQGLRVCEMRSRVVVTGYRYVNGIAFPIEERVQEMGWSECIVDQPNAERCDGLDNDCDGQTDEDFDIGTPCSAGSGACAAVGQFVCASHGLGVVCNADVPQASPEVCDGQDNDCDGVVDDHLSEECQTACGSGFRVCRMGAWGACQVTRPVPEVCNGRDDDCDGLVDEGFDVGAACVVGQGHCSAQGVKVCSEDGLETICRVQGHGLLGTEVCDGEDNDCDGLVDEGSAICPSGQVCFKGQCVYD